MIEAYLVTTAILIVAGSYVFGHFSGQVSSPGLRSTLFVIGLSMPFVCAAGSFLVIAPARHMSYNLMLFGIALMVAPVSATMTFLGRIPARGK